MKATRIGILLGGILLFNLAHAVPVVSGFIYGLNNAGKYEGLEKVKVIAYRFTDPGESTESLRGGRFEMPVSEGVPFTVVFIGDENKMPEIQQLAGKRDARNHVHVTLLTPEQYLSIGASRKALELKLDSASQHLSELLETELSDEDRERVRNGINSIKKFKERLDVN